MLWKEPSEEFVGDRDKKRSVSGTATASDAVSAEAGVDAGAVTRDSWGGAVTDRLAWKPTGLASLESGWVASAGSWSRARLSSAETAPSTVPATAESPCRLSSGTTEKSRVEVPTLCGSANWTSSEISTVVFARGLAGVSSLALCIGAISAGVTGVGGRKALDDRRDTGVHGRFLTGVCGRSGSSTVNPLLKGHSVFSNCRIWSSTPLSSKARRVSSWFPTGTSILQYCGRRIWRTYLLDCSSTHQHWLLGRIGCRAEPQLRKATEPGAR